MTERKKWTVDSAVAEDFLEPPTGDIDIFAQGPVVLVDDTKYNIKREICSSILDEMMGLNKVVRDVKTKLQSLSEKFYVLKNGDTLSGNYTINFDKDNRIKSEGEIEKILYNKFIDTYSLDIKEITEKIDGVIELLKYMSKDIKSSYCEVDIFAQEKKEPVQC